MDIFKSFKHVVSNATDIVGVLLDKYNLLFIPRFTYRDGKVSLAFVEIENKLVIVCTDEYISYNGVEYNYGTEFNCDLIYDKEPEELLDNYLVQLDESFNGTFELVKCFMGNRVDYLFNYLREGEGVSPIFTCNKEGYSLSIPGKNLDFSKDCLSEALILLTRVLAWNNIVNTDDSEFENYLMSQSLDSGISVVQREVFSGNSFNIISLDDFGFYCSLSYGGIDGLCAIKLAVSTHDFDSLESTLVDYSVQGIGMYLTSLSGKSISRGSELPILNDLSLLANLKTIGNPDDEDEWGTVEPLADEPQSESVDYMDDVLSFDEDEEEIQQTGKFANIDLHPVVKCQVPKDIKEVRVVALKKDNIVVAFRFKTDKGDFDMVRAKAEEFGLPYSRVATAIPLNEKNGILMSKSEIKNRRCIPDVSECEEDVRTLFNIIYS